MIIYHMRLSAIYMLRSTQHPDARWWKHVPRFYQPLQMLLADATGDLGNCGVCCNSRLQAGAWCRRVQGPCEMQKPKTMLYLVSHIAYHIIDMCYANLVPGMQRQHNTRRRVDSPPHHVAPAPCLDYCLTFGLLFAFPLLAFHFFLPVLHVVSTQ